MTVAGKPNLLYVLDTLVYELSQISVENNYFTKSVTVVQPDFPPQDYDRVFNIEHTPALLVWLLKQGHGRTQNTLQNVFITAEIEVMCIVKAREDVQYQAAGLVEDVRRVMLSNPTRVHPNLLGGAYPFAGVSTWEHPRGTEFFLQNLQESVSICVVGTTWNVEYNFPIQTG